MHVNLIIPIREPLRRHGIVRFIASAGRGRDAVQSIVPESLRQARRRSIGDGPRITNRIVLILQIEQSGTAASGDEAIESLAQVVPSVGQRCSVAVRARAWPTGLVVPRERSV